MSIDSAPRKPGCDILLVENSPTQAERLRFALEGNRHKVRVAASGPLALDLVRERPPTVVASNIVTGGMDGYALCRALKGDPSTRGIHVILLTPLSGAGDVIRGLDCGADDILCKPFSEVELLDRVDFFLRNQEIRRTRGSGESHEIILGGERIRFSASPTRMLDLLLSAFDMIARKNEELGRAHRELKRTQAFSRAVGDPLPICAKCKKIQDARGDWVPVEEYFRAWADLSFTHEFCGACSEGLRRQPG